MFSQVYIYINQTTKGIDSAPGMPVSCVIKVAERTEQPAIAPKI